MYPQIVDERLRRLYDYWKSKCGDRVAPARSDIEPQDIRELLPYIYMVERIGQRFRFRLAGTSVVAEYGEEITGRFLDEIDLDGLGTSILDEYRSVVTTANASASRWHFTKDSGRDLTYEHLLLPLSNDGHGIDMLLCAAIGRGVGPFRKAPASEATREQLAEVECVVAETRS